MNKCISVMGIGKVQGVRNEHMVVASDHLTGKRFGRCGIEQGCEGLSCPDKY